MSNTKTANRKRTGLPGGKIPRKNRRKGILKFPGATHTPGISELPAHLQKRFF